ncbi:MAG: trigger factor [Ignavibacteria bacterium]|nr:trigger factor [Ignavibacteria bacterium]
MEYKINDLTDSQREVEVTLPYDEIKKEIETEVQKQTKKIQMPGFRKGKVPLNMIKKMYGDALEYEASEKIANSKFWQVAKEKELNPIGQPQLMDIKFKPGEDLLFKVRYEVLPELEVKDYKNLEIELPDLIVKDEEVEHEIEHIIKANSTTEDSEVVGDDKNYLLNIEVQRVDENGNPVPDSKPETLDIDLSNERVNSEINKNAKGKKAGEYFTFTFKDESAKKTDDKEETKVEDYHYKAKINSIKKIKPPELNEELIKKVTKDKLSTEQELRDGIKKDIQAYYNQRVDELLRDKLLHTIVENNDFIPPQTMVKNVLDDLVKQEEETIKKSGYKKFNREEAEKKLEKSAELEVKWFLIKRAIEKQENITIADEDLKDLAKKDVERTGLPEDKLINYYKTSNINEKLLDKKLFDFLREQSKIKKVNPEILINKETEESK